MTAERKAADATDTTDIKARSPGARRRQERRARREHLDTRARALGWWTSPGVLLFVVAIGLAVAGWALVLREAKRIPVTEATIEGLQVQLADAKWLLDQMNHGQNFSKPQSMMPDMPEFGLQRVTVDLAFYNRSGETQRYDGLEFFLVPERGDEVPPVGAQVGHAVIGPGQLLNTALHFDFDTREPHGKLRMAWRRGDRTVYFPVPAPAEHYHLKPRPVDPTLPPKASMVSPLGRPEIGAELYAGRFGCGACHGDPAISDSNNVGPHLGGISSYGAERIEGMAADQYIYESITRPGSFISPQCANDLPCESPSAMPEYLNLMSLQDIADVLAYLLES